MDLFKDLAQPTTVDMGPDVSPTATTSSGVPTYLPIANKQVGQTDVTQ